MLWLNYTGNREQWNCSEMLGLGTCSRS